MGGERDRDRIPLHCSKYTLLINKEYFSKAKLNKTQSTIYFPNGLNFDLDTLYSISIPAKIISDMKMRIKAPKTKTIGQQYHIFYDEDLKEQNPSEQNIRLQKQS